MRKNGLASRLSIGFCILLLAAVFTNIGFAQDEEVPQQLLSYNFFQVKPGMALEFEEFVKNSIPALKETGVTEMTVLRTANFGMSGKYLFSFPLEDPAVMDAELSAPQSNVPVGIIPMMSALERMVVSIHTFMLIPQPDLNIPPAEDYEWKLIAKITMGTAPGRREDFIKGFKPIVDAIGKTNVKGVLIGQVGFGGNLDEYITYVLYDSFTEMTNNDPVIQKELAAIDLTPLNGVVYYRDSEVMVRIPELCIEPTVQ